MTTAIGNFRVLLSRAQSIADRSRKRNVTRHDSNGSFWLPSSHLVIASTILLNGYLWISATAANAQDGAERPRAGQEQLVHHGDLIDVDVIGGFEFDWRGSINPEGFLDGIATYDEPIYALCRTEGQIAAEVAKAYSKILRDPKVNVKIIDRSNRALVRVEGAVRTPTRFSIRRPVRLSELLILAGGIANGASGEIHILRPDNLSCVGGGGAEGPRKDNWSRMGNIKINDLLSGKDSANPMIASGDIVTVSKALPVYVIGAVHSPGQVYLTDNLVLGRAIASAGGLSTDADPARIKIFRRGSGGSSVVDIDLSKVAADKLEDEVLRAFDIIEVPAKGGSKRTIPPAAPFSERGETTWAQMPLKIVD